MKKNIAVIFGGESSEYEISLMSCAFVLKNIDRERYNIVTVGITKTGQWLLYSGTHEDIATGEWINNPNNVTAFLTPDKKVKGVVAFYPDRTEIINIDVIFPVLHGKNGEDGTIQGLFKLSGIPYVGCNHLSSAICMDKAVTHSLLNTANIKQAYYLWFYFDRYLENKEVIINKISARLNFPVFVKPANAGSSVGVSKVLDELELDMAIKKAAREDVKIIVEQGVVGRELECAVLGGRDPVASPIGEVATGAEFYDYNDKYVNGTSVTHIPADIDEGISNKIRETAISAYKYLGCSGFARVDFFLTANNDIVLNEINTIPGFTAISMYPKLWESAGVSGTELVDRLIKNSFDRYE